MSDRNWKFELIGNLLIAQTWTVLGLLIDVEEEQVRDDQKFEIGLNFALSSLSYACANHGVDFQACVTEVSDYIAKVEAEESKGCYDTTATPTD